MDDEDYAEFKANIDTGKTAVVGGIDENDPQWLIICFEDGLEVFNIHKLMSRIRVIAFWKRYAEPIIRMLFHESKNPNQ